MKTDLERALENMVKEVRILFAHVERTDIDDWYPRAKKFEEDLLSLRDHAARRTEEKRSENHPSHCDIFEGGDCTCGLAERDHYRDLLEKSLKEGGAREERSTILRIIDKWYIGTAPFSMMYEEIRSRDDTTETIGEDDSNNA